MTGLVAAVVLWMPPAYEAESRLMVRIGREYAYRPEVVGSQVPRSPTLAEIVNSEVEILSSRELAEQVVASIGVRELYPPLLEEAPSPERAAELSVVSFRKAVSIRPVLESSVIRVGFEHASPEMAARAVNLLVDRFVDKHLAVFGVERSDALQQQLEQRHASLAAAEQALAAFKERNGLFDLAEQRRLLLGQRHSLDGELRRDELELAELRLVPTAESEAPFPVELPLHLAPGMLDALVRQLFELESELRSLAREDPDPLVQDATLRLLDLELEEAELLRDYSEGNRKVRGVRVEIERVRQFLALAEEKASSYEEIRRGDVEAKGSDLRSRIAMLRGEIELLVWDERQRLLLDASARRQAVEARCEEARRRQRELEAQLRELNGHEAALAQLDRERAAALAALEEWRARVEDARLSEELDRDRRLSVRVIERAIPPAVPSGLSRNLKLALGVVVGLFAGVGSAMVAELFRSR